MNRAKKEDVRKYNDARKGKSPEDITKIDRQDRKDEKIRELANRLHGSLFAEEYDFMNDSISDSNDRKKGINPMSKEYIKKMDDKRIGLGFSPLSPSGKSTSNDTVDFCMKLAKSAYLDDS